MDTLRATGRSTTVRQPAAQMLMFVRTSRYEGTSKAALNAAAGVKSGTATELPRQQTQYASCLAPKSWSRSSIDQYCSASGATRRGLDRRLLPVTIRRLLMQGVPVAHSERPGKALERVSSPMGQQQQILRSSVCQTVGLLFNSIAGHHAIMTGHDGLRLTQPGCGVSQYLRTTVPVEAMYGHTCPVFGNTWCGASTPRSPLPGHRKLSNLSKLSSWFNVSSVSSPAASTRLLPRVKLG